MKLQQRICSVEDLAILSQRQEGKIITLFSGGLDSAYLLHLLAQQHCTNVIALTVDLGDDIDLAHVEQVTNHFQAHSIVLDRKDLFAQEAVLPAIAAQAKYLGMYPISASLSRPIIAQEAIRLARTMDCAAILHTANQSQNSLRRLNGAIQQFGFAGYYGTPYEFTALSRQDKAAALQNTGFDYFKQRLHSGDSNLWCREFESGSLDDPEMFHTPVSLYKWSVPSSTASPTTLEIRFDSGVPTRLNGRLLPIVEMIGHLNNIVGRYGLGRYAGLEHLDQGEKVLEVREMPAAFLLLDAYRHLETASLSADTLKQKIGIEQTWVMEAIEGRWFGELKQAAESFITSTSKHVNGTVAYRLNLQSAEVFSIQADSPLYLRDRDAWEKEVATLRGVRNMLVPC
jgi:argininosuccinate synthase